MNKKSLILSVAALLLMGCAGPSQSLTELGSAEGANEIGADVTEAINALESVDHRLVVDVAAVDGYGNSGTIFEYNLAKTPRAFRQMDYSNITAEQALQQQGNWDYYYESEFGYCYKPILDISNTISERQYAYDYDMMGIDPFSLLTERDLTPVEGEEGTYEVEKDKANYLANLLGRLPNAENLRLKIEDGRFTEGSFDSLVMVSSTQSVPIVVTAKWSGYGDIDNIPTPGILPEYEETVPLQQAIDALSDGFVMHYEVDQATRDRLLGPGGSANGYPLSVTYTQGLEAYHVSTELVGRDNDDNLIARTESSLYAPDYEGTQIYKYDKGGFGYETDATESYRLPEFRDSKYVSRIGKLSQAARFFEKVDDTTYRLNDREGAWNLVSDFADYLVADIFSDYVVAYFFTEDGYGYYQGFYSNDVDYIDAVLASDGSLHSLVFHMFEANWGESYDLTFSISDYTEMPDGLSDGPFVYVPHPLEKALDNMVGRTYQATSSYTHRWETQPYVTSIYWTGQSAFTYTYGSDYGYNLYCMSWLNQVAELDQNYHYFMKAYPTWAAPSDLQVFGYMLIDESDYGRVESSLVAPSGYNEELEAYAEDLGGGVYRFEDPYSCFELLKASLGYAFFMAYNGNDNLSYLDVTVVDDQVEKVTIYDYNDDAVFDFTLEPYAGSLPFGFSDGPCQSGRGEDGGLYCNQMPVLDAEMASEPFDLLNRPMLVEYSNGASVFTGTSIAHFVFNDSGDVDLVYWARPCEGSDQLYSVDPTTGEPIDGTPLGTYEELASVTAPTDVESFLYMGWILSQCTEAITDAGELPLPPALSDYIHSSASFFPSDDAHDDTLENPAIYYAYIMMVIGTPEGLEVSMQIQKSFVEAADPNTRDDYFIELRFVPLLVEEFDYLDVPFTL